MFIFSVGKVFNLNPTDLIQQILCNTKYLNSVFFLCFVLWTDSSQVIHTFTQAGMGISSNPYDIHLSVDDQYLWFSGLSTLAIGLQYHIIFVHILGEEKKSLCLHSSSESFTVPSTIIV